MALRCLRRAVPPMHRRFYNSSSSKSIPTNYNLIVGVSGLMGLGFLGAKLYEDYYPMSGNSKGVPSATALSAAPVGLPLVQRPFFYPGETLTRFTFAPPDSNGSSGSLPKIAEKKCEEGEKVMSSSRYTLLYFTASWCPPCQSFTPVLRAFMAGMNGDDVKNSKIVPEDGINREKVVDVIVVSCDASERDLEVSKDGGLFFPQVFDHGTTKRLLPLHYLLQPVLCLHFICTHFANFLLKLLFLGLYTPAQNGIYICRLGFPAPLEVFFWMLGWWRLKRR